MSSQAAAAAAIPSLCSWGPFKPKQDLWLMEEPRTGAELQLSASDPASVLLSLCSGGHIHLLVALAAVQVAQGKK